MTKAQRGGTLIELLAGMAILAILVAWVAPNLIDALDSSVESQALTDSTTVMVAANDFSAALTRLRSARLTRSPQVPERAALLQLTRNR